MLHFKLEEFDSPDLPGSGAEFMDEEFLNLLDRARDEAGVSFKITSGFRTPEYSIDLKKRGYPFIGFRRIGIGKGFIHVDLDRAKVQDVVWVY